MSSSYQLPFYGRRPQVLSRAPATYISRATLERAALLTYGGQSDLSVPWVLGRYEDYGYEPAVAPYAGNVAQDESNEILPVGSWGSLPGDGSFGALMMGCDPSLFYGGRDVADNLPTTANIDYGVAPESPDPTPPSSSTATTTTTPDTSVDGTHRCAWCTDGVSCNAALEDASPAAIVRHLKEVHFPMSWHAKARTRCSWHDTGAPCSAPKELEYGSLGKHIAAVHLKSTACACTVCTDTFTRGDSLLRHVKKMHPAVV